ncbi:pentapeptide repeat-containing protein [Pseudonocardia sp.]|uniref:pentapeptide repeat-containing protein n=1 Tax=Pseudonocardia sp. TaxID=60912 RepID=UPI003D0C910A
MKAEWRRRAARALRVTGITSAITGVLAAAAIAYALTPNLYPPTVDPRTSPAVRATAESGRLVAITATRASILAALAGIAAFGTIMINYRNLHVTVETFRVAERGHLTDRYAKAIELLGDEQLAVRLGGIYALQQYAQDSKLDGDQLTVVEVLSAFIRIRLDGVGGDNGTGIPPEADVLAAISVLAHLPPREKVMRADFRGTLFHSIGIKGARLENGDLRGVRMETVGLRGANLDRIKLDGANFGNATLSRASLVKASLRDIDLRDGRLAEAVLRDADLRGAVLANADLKEADLRGANLRGADITGAELDWADFTGADLTGAQLGGAKLKGATLKNAIIDHGALTKTQIDSAGDVPAGLRAAPPRPTDG